MEEAIFLFKKMEKQVEYLEMRLEDLTKLSMYIKSENVDYSTLEGLMGGYVRRYHKGQWATSIFDGLDIDTIKTALLAVANNRNTRLTVDATTPVKPFKGKGAGDSLAKRKYNHRVETMLKASEKILKVPNVISNQMIMLK